MVTRTDVFYPMPQESTDSSDEPELVDKPRKKKPAQEKKPAKVPQMTDSAWTIRDHRKRDKVPPERQDRLVTVGMRLLWVDKITPQGAISGSLQANGLRRKNLRGI